PGLWHHIVQRGNESRSVFPSDPHRELYLQLVAHYAARYRTRLLGYCLMTNHVHWIAIPDFPDSLSRTFGIAHAEYSRHLHRPQLLAGHLWQGRFYSVPCDPDHAITALAYVERNPLRAKIVERAELYPWSSAAAHTGHAPLPPFLAPLAQPFEHDPLRWSRVLESDLDTEALEERLREARDLRFLPTSPSNS
ncbi:MAG: transposase, partial [Bryobacteraceae bacterium]|nr:transposase [Bryobacteraceae bacterium]